MTSDQIWTSYVDADVEHEPARIMRCGGCGLEPGVTRAVAGRTTTPPVKGHPMPEPHSTLSFATCPTCHYVTVVDTKFGHPVQHGNGFWTTSEPPHKCFVPALEMSQFSGMTMDEIVARMASIPSDEFVPESVVDQAALASGEIEVIEPE